MQNELFVKLMQIIPEKIWHEITWEEAYNLIWKRLDRDYRNDVTVKNKMDFIKRNPNEVIILNGNLFQWIP